jgi:tetratricopeptide (TPR) repeat protein
MTLPMLFFLSASPLFQAAPDPAVLDRHLQEGEAALAAGRYADAAKSYEKLKELSPATAEVHAKLGLIYFQQRNFSSAVPALRQAIKLKPGLPRVDVLLGMSLSELGQYEEALAGLRKGFGQSADAPLRRLCGLHLQRAYTGLQQDDKAVEVALELSRSYPDDPEVLYHGGRLFANFAYLQTMKLSRVAPDSTWMHQAAGEANESQGLYDAAVREYRQLLARDPNRPGIHFRVARSLLARAQQAGEAEAAGVRKEAAKELEQELRLDPTNANAAYELGELHRKGGDLARAQELFETAVASYPDFEDARIGLGRVLTARGQARDALPHLQKAVALNPANEVPHYQLSVVYRELGNEVEQEKALAEFQRLRGLKPKMPEPTFAPRQVTKQEVEKE